MKKRLAWVGNSSSCNFIIRSWLNCKIQSSAKIPDHETFQLKNLFANNNIEFESDSLRGILVLLSKKLIPTTIRLEQTWFDVNIDGPGISITIQSVGDTSETHNEITTPDMLRHIERYLKIMFKLLDHKITTPITVRYKQDFESDGCGGWGGDPQGPGQIFDGDDFIAEFNLNKREFIKFDGDKLIYPKKWDKILHKY